MAGQVGTGELVGHVRLVVPDFPRIYFFVWLLFPPVARKNSYPFFFRDTDVSRTMLFIHSRSKWNSIIDTFQPQNFVLFFFFPPLTLQKKLLDIYSSTKIPAFFGPTVKLTISFKWHIWSAVLFDVRKLWLSSSFRPSIPSLLSNFPIL